MVISYTQRNGCLATIRWIAVLMLLAAVWRPAAAATTPEMSRITAIDTAEFTIASGPEIPRTGAWEPVALIDRWTPERYDIGREGWYRIRIQLDEPPPERIGILLRRLNMNAALYLNGSLIETGGQFTEPVARNWNYPLYAEPPEALWRPGDNWIHIRHVSYRGYGYISPLYVGPAAELRPHYELLYAMQIRVAQFLFPVTLATALFIFSIWLRRKKDTAYLWFATAVTAWSMYIVNMFTRNPPMPTKAWEWIAHFSVELWVVAFFVFSYRFVGLKLGKLAWILPAYLAVAAAAYAIGDLEQLNSSSAVFHAVSILIGLALVLRLAILWFKARARSTIPLAAGLVVLLVTGVHDWMFQTGMMSITGTLSLHLHYYCAPLVFMFIAWHLTSRYSRAVDELEDLNLHLAERISAAEQELANRYDQIKAMEQREAVLGERERIARDIHDAVGGRFSSAIMMTDLIKQQKSPESRLESLRDVLSDGLTEVRHLVTAMVGDISNTADLVHYVADKSASMLQSVDISLQLEFDLADVPLGLSNLQALNVARVFQEATNNIIKHSGASTATLTASDRNSQLMITLTDAGKGLPVDETSKQAAEAVRSYGVAGMETRCAQIGATLNIRNAASGGCEVSLLLAGLRQAE